MFLLLLLIHKYWLTDCFYFFFSPSPNTPDVPSPFPHSSSSFFLEFSVSPFQTFFNSGIKEDGGIGEIRLRDPPGIVWQSADKKKNCFGFDLLGWGQGGGQGLVGGAGRLGWQVALLLARLLLLLLLVSSISDGRNQTYLDSAAASCLFFLGKKYQLPVWILRMTTSSTNKKWEPGSEMITATRHLLRMRDTEATLKLCRGSCVCGSAERLFDLWVLISQ